MRYFLLAVPAMLFLSLPISAQQLTLLTSAETDAADDVLVGELPLAALDSTTIIFAGTDPINGSEVWISDGTPAGTRLLADLEPGATGSNPSDFTRAGGLVYFLATTTADGKEVHVTDGTAEGTRLLVDFYPGPASSIGNLGDWAEDYTSPFGEDRFIFLASSPQFDYEPYITDGTTEGTRLLRNINVLPDGFPANFEEGSFATKYTLFNGELYFNARAFQFDTELFATNGTTGGTRLVYSRSGDRNSASPTDLIVYRDSLYFYAGGEGGEPAGLYRTDGTTGGTDLVYAFQPGERYSPQSNQPERKTNIVGGKLVFPVEDPETGRDLWQYDGATGQVSILRDQDEGGTFGSYTPQAFASIGTDLLLYKDQNATSGIELFRTDGTTDGTRIAADLNPGSSGSIVLPSFLVAHQGKLYYNAVVFGAGAGIELYVYDPATDEATLAADINPGGADSRVNNLTSVGDDLYFFARTNETGFGLFKYSPLSTGTTDPTTSFASAGIGVYPNPVAVGQSLTVTSRSVDMIGYARYGLDGRVLEEVAFPAAQDRFTVRVNARQPFVLRTRSGDGRSAAGVIAVRSN